MNESLAHPYAMYSSILSQEEAVGLVVSKNTDTIARLASMIGEAEATTLTGIGSSLHSAQLAVARWRELLPTKTVFAEHAYDRATDSHPSHSRPIVKESPQSLVVALTHRGSKQFTRLALARAKGAGLKTCLITGEGVQLAPEDGDLHITTVPQERSSAHTASLLGSLAVLTAAIEHLAGPTTAGPTTLLQRAIRSGLKAEAQVTNWVARIQRDIRNVWLVGAGSDVVVCREIALKIKETSYVPAEGMTIEEMLHGPFQCVDPRDQLILVDTQRFASERLSCLRKMAAVVGVPTLTVNTGQASVDDGGDSISIERCGSAALDSVGALVVLQLFTYYLARQRGTNPDSFRLDNARFKEAAALVRL